jgi:hypothetical protein
MTGEPADDRSLSVPRDVCQASIVATKHKVLTYVPGPVLVWKGAELRSAAA